MTVGSLFSGIGGIELGLAMCGVGPVLWQAECDPAALAVLAHHWPNVRRYTDVRDVNGSAACVEVICGGFPCQPHSLAGKRRGTNDNRWLWPEFARVISEVEPSAVFIENVPGLRTSGLRNVLADLASLGFDAEWDVFSAAEVGAPHLRRRLFILAYSDSFDCAPRVGSSDEHNWQGQVSGKRDSSGAGIWMVPTPEACRGDDGSPDRLDIAVMGNAVVPQQAALAWRTLTARLAVQEDA